MPHHIVPAASPANHAAAAGEVGPTHGGGKPKKYKGSKPPNQVDTGASENGSGPGTATLVVAPPTSNPTTIVESDDAFVAQADDASQGQSLVRAKGRDRLEQG